MVTKEVTLSDGSVVVIRVPPFEAIVDLVSATPLLEWIASARGAGWKVVQAQPADIATSFAAALRLVKQSLVQAPEGFDISAVDWQDGITLLSEVMALSGPPKETKSDSEPGPTDFPLN